MSLSGIILTIRLKALVYKVYYASISNLLRYSDIIDASMEFIKLFLELFCIGSCIENHIDSSRLKLP